MPSRCGSSRRRRCSLALGTPPRPPLIGLKQTRVCSESRVTSWCKDMWRGGEGGHQWLVGWVCEADAREWKTGRRWEHGFVRRLELPPDANRRKKTEAYINDDIFLEIKIPKTPLGKQSLSDVHLCLQEESRRWCT